MELCTQQGKDYLDCRIKCRRTLCMNCRTLLPVLLLRSQQWAHPLDLSSPPSDIATNTNFMIFTHTLLHNSPLPLPHTSPSFTHIQPHLPPFPLTHVHVMESINEPHPHTHTHTHTHTPTHSPPHTLTPPLSSEVLGRVR